MLVLYRRNSKRLELIDAQRDVPRIASQTTPAVHPLLPGEGGDTTLMTRLRTTAPIRTATAMRMLRKTRTTVSLLL